MRILITGITGFAGGHLTEALQARGASELFGTSRRAQWSPEWQHLQGTVDLRPCDLCDKEALQTLLIDVQPEQIYHLAGYANTSKSFQEPEAAWSGNLTATRILYEAVHAWGGRPRILFVGSGLIYGDPETPGAPLDEGCPLRPTNPYAASKAAADLASFQYTRHPGLDIVRARPFNHIGPRQGPQFAVANFSRQLAAIERGDQLPLLETGDLSPRRDLTDVRDVVGAYILLMERGRSGEAYNIASGVTHSMREILERLLAFTRIPVRVRQQPGLLRAIDSAEVRGGADKLGAETQWSPRIPLDQTLADTLDCWRGRSRREAA